MTTAELLDQAIAIRQGDVVVFKAAHPLTAEDTVSISRVIAQKLDPHGITWLLTSPDFDVSVMRPEES